MGWFWGRESREREVMELLATVGRLKQENGRLQDELRELQELLRYQDADMGLLIEASRRLHRGLDARERAETLLDLAFRPFDLASFYVALVDRKEDTLRFLLYHEGGRVRNHPPRHYSELPGLTGRAIESGGPLYVRTANEGATHGAIFTEAERLSGLIPASWFGVPFGLQAPPTGLVSFQSFHEDAFPESRRRVMEALVSLFALGLSG